MITDNEPVERLRDRLAIMELTARYAYYVDTFQIEPLMDLWTDDAVFDETKVGTGCHRGPDGIRKFFQEGVAGYMDGIVHVTTNHIIDDIDEHGARGVCTVLVEGDVKGGGKLHATAYYEDVYVRSATGWRFRSRVVNPFTAPQVGDYLAAER